ncbi:hypothetical protein SLS57_002578 [Botryosphaeria dothidea]
MSSSTTVRDCDPFSCPICYNVFPCPFFYNPLATASTSIAPASACHIPRPFYDRIYNDLIQTRVERNNFRALADARQVSQDHTVQQVAAQEVHIRSLERLVDVTRRSNGRLEDRVEEMYERACVMEARVGHRDERISELEARLRDMVVVVRKRDEEIAGLRWELEENEEFDIDEDDKDEEEGDDADDEGSEEDNDEDDDEDDEELFRTAREKILKRE